MKLLYITRQIEATSRIKVAYRTAKNLFTFNDQDGFFEASMHQAFDVTARSFYQVQNKPEYVNAFDAVIVNMKCGTFSSVKDRDENFINFFKTIKIKKAIFIGTAKAAFMLPDDVINYVDLIFKREPYKDRGKYSLSLNNQDKIIATTISCPFVRHVRPNLCGYVYKTVKRNANYSSNNKAKNYDVGFSGADAAEHSLRRDTWNEVKNLDVSTIGGLQRNPFWKTPVTSGLIAPRLKGQEYIDALRSSKINLALDGIGEYTFRHHEILSLGEFMLSSNSITELDLVVPIKDGTHYECFSSNKELVDKIHYYLSHEDERLAIAKAGKHLFDQYYSTERHGKELLQRFSQV